MNLKIYIKNNLLTLNLFFFSLTFPLYFFPSNFLKTKHNLKHSINLKILVITLVKMLEPFIVLKFKLRPMKNFKIQINNSLYLEKSTSIADNTYN